MTLFVCEIDPYNGSLRWVRAGHDPAMVYHIASDTFRELGGSGLPLGVAKDSRYQEGACHIEDQQILVIGTDGIWETFNPQGEMFGKERVLATIRENAVDGAAAIRDRILAALQEFRGTAALADDVTLVIAKLDQGRRGPAQAQPPECRI